MYRAKAYCAVARAIQHSGQKGQSGKDVMLQGGINAIDPRLPGGRMG